MTSSAVFLALAVSGQIAFERHDIDAFPAGYQAAVGDLNRDGRPDVVALSTQADRVDWYENPNWRRRPVARTERNIDLALHDVDGDGRLELALAAGFYFDESSRGGEIFLLRQPADGDQLWTKHRIGVDPVVHRLRWGDLDGDGRKELVHASIFGAGSQGAKQPKPARLWAFHVAPRLEQGELRVSKIDETLTVLHGLHVGDLDGDGRDEILTASFEGIFRFDLEGRPPGGRWSKVRIAAGAAAVSAAPGAPRGSSEAAPIRSGGALVGIAAIEPWHGNAVVVYTRDSTGIGWRRQVLDDSLREGHALLAADFDRDGVDEVVAGWRGGSGGLALYDPIADVNGFRSVPLDKGIPVEGLAAADLDLDGRLDLVAIAGRTNHLAWYKNCCR